MIERLVTGIWWVLLMAFVCATALGAVFAAYCGIGNAIIGDLETAGQWLVMGVALAGGTWLACRHRTDLLTG